MSRVLIAGGTGAIGAALARRLLRDPAFEVRVADDRPAPQWMRESCELRSGDLRAPGEARAAMDGCSHVVHLASAEHANVELDGLPFTAIEHDALSTLALIRAALDLEVERFVYASSARVFERAETFPTPEDYLLQCPVAVSPTGAAALSGERACRAAYAEQGFRFTICRPFDVYSDVPTATEDGGVESESELDALLGELARGASAAAAAAGGTFEPIAAGERTRTPTHVQDVAAGLALALGSPKAVGEDFNLGGAHELALAEIARIAWEACDGPPEALSLKPPRALQPGPERSAPSSQKARRLLGWSADVQAQEGLAASARRALAASPSTAVA
ncbi:MAG TPA: NAD(P)-dependent oxidoreductase [Solirubrobacteraceae bacterium]|jgi:nucleoside-diphosphate-sugar epimerase|nr:NAD(P)-dependent oxidoreductase [Solirubrobacteraceae bacterium]